MISNDVIDQVTVQILTPLNLYGILLKRKLKLRKQSELENVMDEAGSNLSLNVNEGQNIFTCCIFIFTFDSYFEELHLRHQNISKKILFHRMLNVLDQKCHSQTFCRRYFGRNTQFILTESFLLYSVIEKVAVDVSN